MKRITWTCPECKGKSTWYSRKGEALPIAVWMYCPRCNSETRFSMDGIFYDNDKQVE